MGTYCTSTSLESILIGTTFDTTTVAPAIAKCITWSENEINKYIGRRYDVSNFDSATSTPPIVTSWCEQLAIANWYIISSRGGKDAQKRGYDIKKDVIDNLKLVRDYKCDIVNSAGSSLTEKTNQFMKVLSNTDDYHTTFNEDDPLAWEIDPDKLEDIRSERQ